jgi:hypothetical protein
MHIIAAKAVAFEVLQDEFLTQKNWQLKFKELRLFQEVQTTTMLIDLKTGFLERS